MGQAAYGATLKLGANLIAELTSITGPSLSVDEIDVSSHDSIDGFKEFVAGMKDPGEISVEGNLISAAQGNYILANITSGETVAIVIAFGTADPATFTCQGFATAFETDSPFEDKLSFSATFKITGKPVLA